LKVIIAGGRDFNDPKLLAKSVPVDWKISEVVSGTAMGADRLGEYWAKEHGIPVKHFPANWDQEGRAAGPIRNRRMASYADALIAFWDGKSRGTRSMIYIAKELGLESVVVRY